MNLEGLTPGNTYYIQMDGYDYITSAFCIEVNEPPANDDLVNAAALVMGAGCNGDSYTNEWATAETAEPQGTCFNNSSNSLNSVWFSFVAPSSGVVSISTDIDPAALDNSQIAVYAEPSDLTDLSTLGPAVGCGQDGGTDNYDMSVMLIYGLAPGNTYYIQVDGNYGITGTFCIEVKEINPPANDNLADAIELVMDAGCIGDLYSNEWASEETGESEGGCFDNFDDSLDSVWFSFTAPGSGNVHISTDILPGQLTNSQIALYPAPMTPGDVSTLGAAIKCDSDGGTLVGSGRMSVINAFGLIPGATYYIQVDGYEDMTGTFCIEVDGLPDFYYVNGVWVPENPNGVAGPEDNIVIMNGTTTFSTDLEINELTIELGASLKVEQALIVNSDIVNDGDLVFVNGVKTVNESQVKMLGQLGNMTGFTITGSGTVTGQRYIPERDDGVGAWRYLTSAVNSTESIHANWQEGANSIQDDPNPHYGMFITGPGGSDNGFDETPANDPSMFTYDNNQDPVDPNDDYYYPIPDTDVETLVAGRAYSAYVWGDRSVGILAVNDPEATTTTLRATGTLLIGPQTYDSDELHENDTEAVEGSHTDTDLIDVAGGFNLVGNPYQAIVDMKEVMDASLNINTNSYYVWDPNLNTRGAYATVSFSTDPDNGNLLVTTVPSTSGANQYLMPGQAVWVTTAIDDPASITFDESAKNVTVDPTNVFRDGGSEMAFIELQLFQAERFSNGLSLSDALRVNFSAAGNNEVTLHDAVKLPNMDENIALVNAGHHLAIAYRALPTDGGVLPLFTAQYRANSYVVRAQVANMPVGTTVFLQDDYLELQTELVAGESTLINISVDETIPASIAPDRFSIVFETNPLYVDGGRAIKGLSIYPNPTEIGEFFIAVPGMAGETVQVSLFNILGQKVYGSLKTVRTNERVNVPVASLQAGVYMVEMDHNGKTFTGKVVVE